MLPLEITQLACGNFVQGIAQRMGKHPSWIYRCCGESQHDPYTRFLDLLHAVNDENPAGADLYATDFQTRHLALKRKGSIRFADWDKILGEAMMTTQDALVEAVSKGDDLEVKITAAIRALQQLLTRHKVESNEIQLQTVGGRVRSA